MNKNNKQRGFSGIAVIGIVAAVVVVVIMFGYSVNSKQSQKAMEDQKMADEKMMMEKKAMEEKDTMMKAGSYEAYSAEKVMLASTTHDVVLFFRASWCPSCRAVDSDIKANLGKIPTSLAILDVNYDNSASLKQKYGVTYQHTFVQVDKDGNMIKKWSGSPTLSALVSEVK